MYSIEYNLILVYCALVFFAFTFKIKSGLIAFSLVPFFIYFGLRGDMLPDYVNYQKEYYLHSSFENVYDGDFFYNVFQATFNKINLNFSYFCAFILCLSFYTKWAVIESRFGSLVLIFTIGYLSKLFLFHDLVTIRQSFAVVFSVFFIHFLDKNKIIAYLSLMVSCLIHPGCILFSLVLLKKFITRPYVILLVLILGLVLVSTPLIDYLLNQLNLFDLLPKSLFYYYYESSLYTEGSDVGSVQSILKTTFIAIIFILNSIVYHKYKKNFLENKSFIENSFYIYAVMIFMRLVFFNFPILSGRGASFLMITGN